MERTFVLETSLDAVGENQSHRPTMLQDYAKKIHQEEEKE